MTLVAGATGALGTEICRRLESSGKPFRATVRMSSDPAKKETLKQLGGDVTEADLKDRASLDRACGGATAVITTSTAILSQQQDDTFDAVDLHGQMHLIDAARAAKSRSLRFRLCLGQSVKTRRQSAVQCQASGGKPSSAEQAHLHDSATDVFHGSLVEPASRLRFCKCQGNDLRLRRKQD